MSGTGPTFDRQVTDAPRPAASAAAAWPQAERAAPRRTGKIWPGAIIFWVAVAALIAARIAFLDPGRPQPAAFSQDKVLSAQDGPALR